MPESTAPEATIPVNGKEPKKEPVVPDTTPDQEHQEPKSRVKRLLGRFKNPFRRFPDTPDPLRRKIVIGGGVLLGTAAVTKFTDIPEHLVQAIIPPHIEKTLTRLPDHDLTEKQKKIDPTPEEQAQVEALIQYKPAEEFEFISNEKMVEIAKEHHLRLYNKSNVGDAYNDLYDRHHSYVKEEPHSFDRYLQVAKDILLTKYGVELILGDITLEYSNGGTPYKPGELESSEQAKHNIINMLESFFDQPVELFETIGLKKICLVKLGKDIGGYVDPGKYSDTYFADITQGSNGTFDHELYHLYDFKKCGDMVATDQGFNASSSDYLGYETIIKVIQGEQAFKHPKGYISDEDFSAFVGKIIQDSYDPATDTYDPKYFEKYQALVDQKAQQVAGVSTYSFANMLEDKAELGVYLFNPNYYSSLFDERKPLLRKKAIFLMARLFHDNPEIVKFFFETSNLVKSEELQYHFKRKPTDTKTP